MQKIKKIQFEEKRSTGRYKDSELRAPEDKMFKEKPGVDKKSGDLQGIPHPDKLPNSEMELKATQTMKKNIKHIKGEVNVIKQESEGQAPASSRTW